MNNILSSKAPLKVEELQKKLQETEEKLNVLHNALEPALEEFVDLNEKFECEQQNRKQAESLALKYEKDNKILKRQSQMLMLSLGKFDVNAINIIAEEIRIDENLDESRPADRHKTTENNELSKRLNSLENENSKLCGEIEQLRAQNKEIKNKLSTSMKRNEELESLINNFKRTSTLALDEFAKLQQQICEETILKEKAEDFARKCETRQKAVAHQSAIIASSVSSDQKLIKALCDIEDLTRQLDEQKAKSKKELSDLEEILKMSKDMERLDAIETQLQISTSEVERLQKAILEQEVWKKEATEEIENLRKKYEEASLFIPPPPPPPPPCPPLPPIPVPIATKKFIRSQSEDPVSPTKSTGQEKLMSDLKTMMLKMKQGDKLLSRTVRTHRKPLEGKQLPPAMEELQKVLAKVKSVKEKPKVETRKNSLTSTTDTSPVTRRPPPNPLSKPKENVILKNQLTSLKSPEQTSL